ncbi:sugar ABC transporter ATP-binding protein [Aminiphilus sp.]|jgi:ABC-type sugar transport system ATPase subunit|uniref:sugar ABC transporter ATP-binding protein n=1 Tax=Aminiphilus sp. TaxID=1872488 RepID=UPI0026200B87|nr:sugar ABC transporter ATP-binding protein [Aminiphilus sp.]
MAEPLLQLKKICKSFPGVKALDDVDFSIREGEVVGLLGENGAGKSTLVKIISGVYMPDSGDMVWHGNKFNIKSIMDAQERGIAIIFQELNNCPNLSALENLFLGREIRSRAGVVDFRAMKKKAQEIFSYLGVQIPLATPVGKLSVALQQMVEIGKALLTKAKLIIMDEPTSSLTEKETRKLFQIIKELKAQNITVIFISHKLEEVFEVTDRLVVLRDGRRVGELETSAANRDSLVSLMVGREIHSFFSSRSKAAGTEVLLKIENFSGPPNVSGVNFELHRGEILGLAGLIGAGRTELALLMFGAEQKTSGKMFLQGKEIHVRSPRQAIENGIAYLSEDRKTKSLILPMMVRENITMSIHGTLSGFLGTLNRKKERELANSFVRLLEIKTSGLDQVVNNLSGGNQQKVVVAKWLATEPSILILDEPTRGIDVHAKAEIHKLITDLADKGTSIILISSELPEVVALSDRVLVMHEGKVRRVLDKAEISQENIMGAVFAR